MNPSYSPYDIIGDVHGCCGELELLLEKLGYRPSPGSSSWRHPRGRRLVFVGDLCDRGPRVLDTIRLVQSSNALCVLGNHDDKFLRWLRGSSVTVNHGLDRSIAEVLPIGEAERLRIADFLASLPIHIVLDRGRLVIAHAGIRQDMIGKSAPRIRSFCLYGDVTGEKDEFGLPIRLDWARDYRGRSAIVYGHTPIAQPEWRNNTINIDTGCVFGGRLTALRYPERQLVSVEAFERYAISPRETDFRQPRP